MRILNFLGGFFRFPQREVDIPPPPFRACKRTGDIMNGLWYGELSPEQARLKAIEWEFPPGSIEEMIEQATQPPSYWSRHVTDGKPDDQETPQ